MLFAAIVVATTGAVVIAGELVASSATLDADALLSVAKVVPTASTRVDSPEATVLSAATLELASSSARELTESALELASTDASLVADVWVGAASRSVTVEV